MKARSPYNRDQKHSPPQKLPRIKDEQLRSEEGDRQGRNNRQSRVGERREGAKPSPSATRYSYLGNQTKPSRMKPATIRFYSGGENSAAVTRCDPVSSTIDQGETKRCICGSAID